MKKHKKVERTYTENDACVEASCDMCGRKAEYPENDNLGMFEWGGSGSSGSRLEVSFYIDGDIETNALDLCYNCGEWIRRNCKKIYRENALSIQKV